MDMGRAYVFLTLQLDRAVQDPADFSTAGVPGGSQGAGSSMALSLKLHKSQSFGMLSPAGQSQAAAGSRTGLTESPPGQTFPQSL